MIKAFETSVTLVESKLFSFFFLLLLSYDIEEGSVCRPVCRGRSVYAGCFSEEFGSQWKFITRAHCPVWRNSMAVICDVCCLLNRGGGYITVSSVNHQHLVPIWVLFSCKYIIGVNITELKVISSCRFLLVPSNCIHVRNQDHQQYCITLSQIDDIYSIMNISS